MKLVAQFFTQDGHRFQQEAQYHEASSIDEVAAKIFIPKRASSFALIDSDNGLLVKFCRNRKELGHEVFA